MKSRSCFIIRCIGSEKINVQELSMKLEQYTKSYFPNARVTLKATGSYWKEPRCNEFIYNFSNDQVIKVLEFVQKLYLSWDYSIEEYYCIDTAKKVYNERAIWSKLCYPEEIFLNSDVDWIHIYTWEDDKEPIVN